MSKNILCALTALLTFQSASAYLFLESSEIKNRIKEAITNNSLERLEYQFKCLEKEGVVFTPDMLETYCQFSLKQIAELKKLKKQASEPSLLASFSSRVSYVAFFSGITGALGYGLLSKLSPLSDASFYEKDSKMCTVSALTGFFLLSVLASGTFHDEACAELNNPLWIQNRLNEQKNIYSFLQQKLSFSNYSCQIV